MRCTKGGKLSGNIWLPSLQTETSPITSLLMLSIKPESDSTGLNQFFKSVLKVDPITLTTTTTITKKSINNTDLFTPLVP